MSTVDLLRKPAPLFVALSYCWGGDQVHKTTARNLKDGNLEGGRVLVYEELPRTIQDALKVSIELGYAYLWVDSLCIVQDDQEEMHREIAQMPIIYSNAVVTIIASAPKKASEGFLIDRQIPDIAFEMSVQLLDGTLGCVGLAPYEFLSVEPLDLRG